ncbi:metal-dependent phosphohydrolase [Micromonospora sp. NPDC093277]|uniref:HD domain-containing protein n=1 Tax=Micromonospora sp. NPDC093277 TaxID=3364291 RepID=UPI0037F11E09
MDELMQRWRDAAHAAGAADPAGVERAGARLLTAWREPHRRYHTTTHLRAVLDVIDAYSGSARRPALVRLAAWCHDAVYDPRAGGDTNERASAELAGDLLAAAGLPADAVTEVRRLVLLTAGHATRPDDPDGALLCDADLAILAAPPDGYDRYATAVRHEYAHVPDPAFRAGRAAVLAGLLDLPTLYRLPAPHARWEVPARANLTRELAALRAG